MVFPYDLTNIISDHLDVRERSCLHAKVAVFYSHFVTLRLSLGNYNARDNSIDLVFNVKVAVYTLAL